MRTIFYMLSDKYKSHVWSLNPNFTNSATSKETFYYSIKEHDKESSLKLFEKTLGILK